MTVSDIVAQLKLLGGESYKRTMLKHGVKEPLLGVKIEELKKIQRQVKKNYQLSMDLYDTGIYDAQYLAGLIADDAKMTKKDLQGWLAKANSATVCGYVVAKVAAGSTHGHELATEWIESKKEDVAQAGWSTLASLVSITDDSKLDLAELRRLLQRIAKTVHQQPDRVRYVMNGLVIAVGIYVKDLTEIAMQTAMKIGKVTVDTGETECKVPCAPDYIEKARKRGVIGKKRKNAMC